MKSYEKTIVEAIKSSVKNHEWCCSGRYNKRNLLYKVKYISWYILLIFLSPYKTVTSSKFVCAFTPVNEKRLIKYCDDNEYYTFAKLNASIRQLVRNRSVLSPYSRLKRIYISFNGLVFFLIHRKELHGYLHFTLEYYAIAYYIRDKLPKEIIMPGMYDRYCTLLSYLGHGLGICLIGVQDGAAVDIQVPVKVYCDKMYAFDEFEGEIIKSFIKNSDCRFVWSGFSSMINWSIYPKRDKKIIAIASQDWFTNKTLELIEVIMSRINTDRYEVIVYPHYREDAKQYNEVCKKYPSIILESQLRYSNIDLLITFYSTIVYDFWSVNKNLNVLCLRLKGYEPGYYMRPNVYVAESYKELIEYLKMPKIWKRE
ncbi:hypothetical protein [Lacrimispora sp.]|uniref:hypothetical protein n=1 Tax=Lacrimispora sp. TaxID=2719234 RepID=UPI00345F70DF